MLREAILAPKLYQMRVAARSPPARWAEPHADDAEVIEAWSPVTAPMVLPFLGWLPESAALEEKSRIVRAEQVRMPPLGTRLRVRTALCARLAHYCLLCPPRSTCTRCTLFRPMPLPQRMGLSCAYN